MTVLRRWQATIVDEAGNVQPAATVTVRHTATGNLVTTLKSNRAGTGGLSNPVTADANGFAFFYVAGGRYDITATKGAFSRTWTDVAIGT
ncbi:MAG: carboxypeptidase regulatory-like domain-containing protein, partial [Anaerolineaceae bacterium]